MDVRKSPKYVLEQTKCTDHTIWMFWTAAASRMEDPMHIITCCVRVQCSRGGGRVLRQSKLKRDSYRNVTFTEIISFLNKINWSINRFNEVLRIKYK